MPHEPPCLPRAVPWFSGTHRRWWAKARSASLDPALQSWNASRSFKVWHFQGRALPVKEVTVHSEPLDSGSRLLSWTVGPGAAVLLVVNVPAGATLVARGFSGPDGTGHAVDEESVAGLVSNRSFVLFGSPVASVVLFGTGTVTSVRVVPIDAFINDPGWKLVETVGLPANEAFATTGYPMDPQGPVGAEQAPVHAAIDRVKRGTPDAGWNAITDRGTAVPAFAAPDSSQLVTKELRPLVSAVARMLETVSDPSRHAETSVPVTTSTSIGARRRGFRTLAEQGA